MRQEVIQPLATARISVPAPGVEMRMLVGAHNAAQKLFTGLLTLAPGGFYPYYVRPFSEALILLEGEAAVDVEDRRYQLGPLDAINVTPRHPRHLANLSTSRLAVFHVSLASAVPDQTWVNGRFTPVKQVASVIGRSGSERLCRHDPATRFELAPRASFKISLALSLAPGESAEATAYSNRARAYHATVTSLTSQLQSCRERLPVSWKAAGMICRAPLRRLYRRDVATTSST